jgi:hypothetical protein
MHSGFGGLILRQTSQVQPCDSAKANVLYGSLGCGNTCYQRALTAVSESFATSVGGATSLADLNRGPVHVYSTRPATCRMETAFA